MALLGLQEIHFTYLVFFVNFVSDSDWMEERCTIQYCIIRNVKKDSYFDKRKIMGWPMRTKSNTLSKISVKHCPN
jgi:hypothetical protein